MNDLTNTNGVGSIDPKDTINIPENKPYPTKSASGLPERQGETAVIQGGDGIVQQQRMAHDVAYDSRVPVDTGDGTTRPNLVQNAQGAGGAQSVSGEVVHSGAAPVGGINETSFDGTGKSVPTAPVGEPYGVQNLSGGVDWFATEEQAQQYADSNPGFYRIRGETNQDKTGADLTKDQRDDLSDLIVWSKGDDGKLHQFANDKTRRVMLESEPLLGHEYEPTQAEIDAWTGVVVNENDASERVDAPRDTVKSLGPVSSDGKFYAKVDNEEGAPRAFENEADRDAFVASTPGAVAYTLPTE